MIKKPPCEQGGHLTIACHMNKLFDFKLQLQRQAGYEPYFLLTESAFLAVVSIFMVVVSVLTVVSVVAGGIEFMVALSVAVESLPVVVLLLLLQATNTPAIAKIPRNFFMRISILIF